MKIAKIKNRLMFKSNQPNQTHDWLLYKDKSTGSVQAVELTHIYIKDPKRAYQLKRGLIKEIKLPHRKLPSGIANHYHNKTVDGKNLSFEHPDIDLNSYSQYKVSKSKEKQVIRFANKPQK